MKELIKIDKNGTKHYKVKTCPKCGGTGRLEIFNSVENGVCFKCGGTGEYEHIEKEYTKEYLEKKRLKEELEMINQSETENQKFFKNNGFNTEGYIYKVITDNDYSIKDKLKEYGARYYNYLGWYFPTDNKQYKTIKIHAEDICHKNIYGWYYSIDCVKVVDYLNSIEDEQQDATEYIGEVGDKIEIEVMLERINSFSTKYGKTYIYTFKDSKDNILTWKSTKDIEIEENEKVKIKGTIKEHKLYNNKKQTVLTRCKI